MSEKANYLFFSMLCVLILLIGVAIGWFAKPAEIRVVTVTQKEYEKVEVRDNSQKPVSVEVKQVPREIVIPQYKPSPTPAETLTDSELPKGVPNDKTYWIWVKKSECSAYLMKGRGLCQTFQCATSREESKWSTPVGWYHVSRVAYSPSWNPSSEVRAEYGLPMSGRIPADDSRNALGPVWMPFAESPSLGLHGNNDATRIGTRDTHGCVSFENKDALAIAQIFSMQKSRPVYVED